MSISVTSFTAARTTQVNQAEYPATNTQRLSGKRAAGDVVADEGWRMGNCDEYIWSTYSRKRTRRRQATTVAYQMDVCAW